MPVRAGGVCSGAGHDGDAFAAEGGSADLPPWRPPGLGSWGADVGRGELGLHGEALAPHFLRHVLTLKYPIAHGILTSWDGVD